MFASVKMGRERTFILLDSGGPANGSASVAHPSAADDENGNRLGQDLPSQVTDDQTACAFRAHEISEIAAMHHNVAGLRHLATAFDPTESATTVAQQRNTTDGPERIPPASAGQAGVSRNQTPTESTLSTDHLVPWPGAPFGA
jgi:hypothetical protein